MTKTINRIEWFGKMDGIIVDLESLMGTDDALNNISNKKDFFSKSYCDEEGEIWQRGIDRTAHSVIYKAKLFLCHFVKLKLFQMGVQQIANEINHEL